MYDEAEKTRVGNSWSGSRPTSQSCSSLLSAVPSAPGSAQRPWLAIQSAAYSFPYCPWHPQASLLLLHFSASPALLSWFPPHFSVDPRPTELHLVLTQGSDHTKGGFCQGVQHFFVSSLLLPALQEQEFQELPS